MWLLRNGQRIRIELIEDPCWNTEDIWSARNNYAKFISLGYSKNESTSLASAAVWKHKWPGTSYSLILENALKATA